MEILCYPLDNNNWIQSAWYFSIKQKSGETRYINSANLFVRKNIFVKINGFDIKLKAGEDRELSWRIQKLGYKTVINERLIVIHTGYPKTIRSFFKREVWHGKAIASDLRYPKKTRMLYILVVWNLIIIMYFCSIIIYQSVLFLFGLILLISFPIMIAFIKCLKKGYINIFSIFAFFILFTLPQDQFLFI